MRKLFILFFVVMLIGISGCSNSTDNKAQPTMDQTLAQQPITTILTPKVTAKIDYTVLEEFKVFNQDKGYGALILVKNDAAKDEIIDVVKKIGENKDPVAIIVFTSRQAYEEYKTLKTTDEFKKGYVASYTKNKTLFDKAYYGDNKITWTQEIGNLSSMYLTSTDLDKE